MHELVFGADLKQPLVVVLVLDVADNFKQRQRVVPVNVLRRRMAKQFFQRAAMRCRRRCGNHGQRAVDGGMRNFHELFHEW
jgi:hypothetical protein